MRETVYIIGHKNPDADAVCSAIGYAAFKKVTGAPDHFVPARCGNSNARIDAILKRFNTPLPQFIGDVAPRVEDIMRRDIIKADIDSTCGEALERIDAHDVRALPVVSSDGRLKGTVSVFNLGEFFMPKLREPREMRHVSTSINDIVRLLKARILHLEDPDCVEDLFIRVGAMDIKSFGRFQSRDGIQASESVIIVGDRYDIQQKAIAMGSRLIVATGGLELDDDVISLAREKRVSLVVSNFDTATTAMLIRTASRLSPMIDQKAPTFRLDDKISLIRKKVTSLYSPLYCVVDEDERLLGVFSRTDLVSPKAKKLVLVDHNELGQAVNGAGECDIIEIIDHHRLGNPPTAQPIKFRNDVVGSTCTIVASMFREFQIEPDPSTAGILMCGLISDTLNLQGPTTTAVDTELLPWLASLAKADLREVTDLIFSSGSVILSSKPIDAVKSDCKQYEQGEVRYSVAQIEELGFSNFWQRNEELLTALEQYRASEGLDFSALMVTDINKQNSLLLVQGDPEIISNIDYLKVDSGRIFDMPGIVSRKKQLIPYFSTLLDNLVTA